MYQLKNKISGVSFVIIKKFYRIFIGIGPFHFMKGRLR